MVAPYQIALHDGRLIFAPQDSDQVVRLRPPPAPDAPSSPEYTPALNEDEEPMDDYPEDYGADYGEEMGEGEEDEDEKEDEDGAAARGAEAGSSAASTAVARDRGRGGEGGGVPR